MSANYITQSSSRHKPLKKALLRPILASGMLLTLLLVTISGVFGITKEKAQAEDFINWLVCDSYEDVSWWEWTGPEDANITGEGSLTQTVYRMTNTDDLPFAVASKSTVNAGTQDVDSILNSMMSGFGDPLSVRNEPILGYSLLDDEPIGEPNGGLSVTAFDRFGTAGLTWTRYNGEWKYITIDTCLNNSATDTKIGVFYEDRLEPKTTFGGIKDSKDIRSVQHGGYSGLATKVLQGFNNTTANWLFNITKFIVAFAVLLVNIAFSDLVTFFGVNDLIGGESGIFSSLFNGIYTPFIIIVFVGTGFMILWQGVVKRQFRNAFGMLLRSLLLFVVAIVISVNPLFWVALPNAISTVAQSVVINAMGAGMASGSGICSTGGGEVAIMDEQPADATDASQAQNLLEQASQQMRSVVSCQLWSTFLLKPWSIGQFGADYNELYANDKIPGTAAVGSKSLGNDNDAMVGDAAVPMGGGTVINNWALFQVSTQTNVHVPIGLEGEPSEYTNGVANDWYRIVDALSNYSEVETETETGTTSNDENVEAVKFMIPDTSKKPNEYWGTWVGGNGFDRIGVALTSILAAIAGLLTVIIFGFLSAAYAFGIAIAMAFAPLFFLAGGWGNRGFEIFQSWLQLVLNLMVKRVLIGMILVLNLIILTAVLSLFDSKDYFWSVAVMGFASYILFKFKDQLISTVGGIFQFNFADDSLNGKAAESWSRMRGNLKKGTQGLTNIGAASLMGGIAAKRNGHNFATGASMAFKKEAVQQAYRQDSKMARQALNVYESMKPVESFETCVYCGQPLKSIYRGQNGTVVRDSYGNSYCMDCAALMGWTEDVVATMDGYTYQEIKFDNEVKDRKPVKANRVVSNAEGVLNEEYVKLVMRGEVQASIGEAIVDAIRKDVQLIEDKEGIPTTPSMVKQYSSVNAGQAVEEVLLSGDFNRIEALPVLYATAVANYIDGLSEDEKASMGLADMSAEDVKTLIVNDVNKNLAT